MQSSTTMDKCHNIGKIEVLGDKLEFHCIVQCVKYQDRSPSRQQTLLTRLPPHERPAAGCGGRSGEGGESTAWRSVELQRGAQAAS